MREPISTEQGWPLGTAVSLVGPYVGYIDRDSPLRIAIAGGSLGGLTAAVLLHEQGHDVHVFERSTHALEGRGAGIAVLPMTERYFREQDQRLSGGTPGGDDGQDPVQRVALTLTNWSYVDKTGTVTSESATNYRFTSWNTIYRALLRQLPAERYHLASEVTGLEQSSGSVTVQISGRGPHRCDLLLGADGIASAVRSIVSPETKTDYAGYVAWRGIVLEQDLTPRAAELLADALLYQVLDHAHILVYAIPGPGDSTEVGTRAINFVWYRNYADDAFRDLMTDRDGVFRPSTMPPGLAEERHVDELRTRALEVLAPQLADVVLACPDPFVQTIFDMTAERFVHDRVVLIGDAACAVRPHVAAGTAKACADGWALRDHLVANDDLDAALAAWESQQVAMARATADKSRRMGIAAQFEAMMMPDDPDWRFGLFGPGD